MHNQSKPLTTTFGSELDDDGGIDSLARPLHSRDFTLSAEAQEREVDEDTDAARRQQQRRRDHGADEAAEEHQQESDSTGFDASSEGGTHDYTDRGGRFDIREYLWASNCVREDYDELGTEGMRTTYFVEGKVASLLEQSFGARRRTAATPTTTAAPPDPSVFERGLPVSSSDLLSSSSSSSSRTGIASSTDRR